MKCNCSTKDAYHLNGVLVWRRILRRRTTGIPPQSTTPISTDGGGLGLIGSATMTQVLGGILLGGLSDTNGSGQAAAELSCISPAPRY